MNAPRVQISSPDGIPTKSTVTVDGVLIPCTKATWTADATDGRPATALLEVPHVGLTAEAREVVARYVALKSFAPMFWWNCPCGMEMGHQTIEHLTEMFHNPVNHIAGCEHVPATPAADGPQ